MPTPRIIAIQAELTAGHPVTGAYSANNDTARDEMNAVNVSRNKTLVTGSDIYDQTVGSEFSALADTQKTQWLALCAIQNIDPFGPAVQVVLDIFGGGSSTVSALQAFRTETVSQGVALGLGVIVTADIEDARA